MARNRRLGKGWKLLLSPRKLPGIGLLVIGLGWRLLDIGGRLDLLVRVIEQIGGSPALIASIVSSVWFSVALVAAGVVYLIFVGEPGRGVQRQRWWSAIGWGIFVLSFAGMVGTATVGYVVLQVRPPDRHLSAEQRSKIIDAMMPKASSFPLKIAVIAAEDPEATGYAIEIMSALRAGNAPVASTSPYPNILSPGTMRALNRGVREVFVQVHDPQNPPGLAETLAGVLEAGDIKVGYAENLQLDTTGFILTIGLR